MNQKNKDTSKKIRIIMVIPGKEEGNSMIFSKDQAKYLMNEGIIVQTFFIKSCTNPFILFKEFIRFISKIKYFQPDIIHADYGTMTSFFSALGSLINRIPLVILFRGSDLNNTAKTDGFFRDLFGRILSQISALKASKIICVSKKLSNRLWWKKHDVEIIFMGVDLESIYLIDKEKARSIIGWNNNAKIVLFNANNPKIKRLDLALASIEVAKKYNPSILLEIVKGDVPHEKMVFYLNAADCLLVTSDYEGSPQLVKEAMVCNLPIVSVDVGDVSDRLKDVFPSKIVQRDPEKLGIAIFEILELNCRSNSRLVTEKQLCHKKHIRDLIKIYENILN